MGKEKQKLNNFALPVNITDKLIEWLPVDFWTDPTKKVCYLSIVDGYVIDRMIDRFNEGLKDIIADDNKRMNHILDNMIYGISSTESNTRRAKWISQIKNIYTRNILKEDINDMPKFDFLIQNPPYSGSLHLDFLKKGYEMLSDKGQMIIIEPATWLINVRKNGKAKTIYNPLKEILKGKVRKIIIENYNKEFNTGLYVPFSITLIDKTYNSDNIEYTCCGYTKIVKSLYDCNLIGEYDLVWSIINKFSNCDKVKNHIYIPGKIKKQSNIWYLKIAGDILTGNMMCGDESSAEKIKNTDTDPYSIKTRFGVYERRYISSLCFADKNGLSNIQDTSPVLNDKGNKPTNKESVSIIGTELELKNWKHFLLYNKIPIFISICMTIDQHAHTIDYVPWLVDKNYTDEEIYKKFNITDKEQNFINKVLYMFERHSLWKIRLMCGQKSVSDDEVQKFIEDLNNA